MAGNFFLEENGYVAWVTPWQLDSGKWTAYVTFERRATIDQTFVPAARHILKVEFETRDEAATEAGNWAIERMKRDETRIDDIQVVRNG